MKSKHYVDTNELEEVFGWYIDTEDEDAWSYLGELVYPICRGVSKKFYPIGDEELDELTHQAYVLVMDKIKRGMLRYTPGKAPVFNLFTTAIFRLLYTYKMQQKRKKKKIIRYAYHKNIISKAQLDQLLDF